MDKKLTPQQLKVQACIRVGLFFAIMITIGYWASAIGAMM